MKGKVNNLKSELLDVWEVSHDLFFLLGDLLSVFCILEALDFYIQ